MHHWRHECGRMNPLGVPMLKRSLTVLCLLMMLSPACGGTSAPPTPAPANESRLAAMKRSNSVRIGYGVYPPYLVEGKGPGDVSGYSVDLITQILHSANASVKITWVPTKFDRLALDFQSDKYDLIVEPLIQTLPRALQFGISEPYTFIGYGIPFVRADDRRFSSITDVDKPGINVAVTTTSSSDQFAERAIKQATLRRLPAGSLDQPLLEVLAGRADVALGDEVTVSNYLAAHPGVAKAIKLDDAPEKLGAGFLFPQGDYAWGTFLNAGIAYMRNTGQMRTLAARYGLPVYEISVNRRAGK